MHVNWFVGKIENNILYVYFDFEDYLQYIPHFSTASPILMWGAKWEVSSKVEKISKGSLDSIPPPSPSVKIQIMGGKVC